MEKSDTRLEKTELRAEQVWRAMRCGVTVNLYPFSEYDAK